MNKTIFSANCLRLYPKYNVALNSLGACLGSLLTGSGLFFVNDGKTFFLAGEVDLHLIGHVFSTNRQIDGRRQRIFFALDRDKSVWFRGSIFRVKSQNLYSDDFSQKRLVFVHDAKLVAFIACPNCDIHQYQRTPQNVAATPLNFK